MSRNGYAEIEEGDRREPDYEAYQEEAFAATSSTVLISRKYVVSAFCVGLLVLFLVAIILIVGVDILDGGDDDDWWKGKPKEFGNAAVAAESPVCSKLGTDVLQKGGNAIDAMVTTDLCVGVVHSFATNMGGGGVTVLRTPDGVVEVLDFRERAPSGAYPNMYSENGWSSILGTQAGGVPGTFAGLSAAQKKYGELKWKDLVTPVAELARGFEVDQNLADALVESEDNVLADPGLSSVFAPDGEILKLGDTVIWNSLADTLQRIAEKGVDEFYNGSIGKDFIDDMVNSNPETLMTRDDLRNYSVTWRTPITQHYRGYKIYGAPPPYTGGAIIAQALNILEMYNLPRLGDNVQSQHYLLQTMNYGYSDRTGMGDPENEYNIQNKMNEKIEEMITKDHAADLRENISSSTTYPPEHYIDLFPLTTDTDGSGTSHFSIVDEKGFAVATTTTVNENFGACFMSPSTGLVLNDELNDFNDPSVPLSYFGTPQSPANYPGPGLRPASSMSPTIVTKDNEIYLVLGGSGGKRIITGTFQTLLNFMDFGLNLQDSVNRPRFHDQWVEPIVQWDDGYPESWRKSLKDSFDYNVSSSPQTSTSVVQAIFRSSDGTLYAACDRRKVGEPDGY